MNSFLWVDESWKRQDFDFLSLSDRNGIYETMLVVDGEIKNKTEHEKRFIAGCEFLKLPNLPGPNPPEGLLGEWTLRWARWHGCPMGNLGHLWKGSLQPIQSGFLNVGLVSVNAVPKVPSLNVKHLQLLERVKIKQKIKEKYGWDDYLVVDNDSVLEGSNWALMLLKEGKWVVPKFTKGLLKSTTIKSYLNLGKFEDRILIQQKISLNDLKESKDIRGPSSSGVRKIKIISNSILDSV